MNLVLCMAGLYQRFRRAAYTTPKFLLPWRGRTVIDEILSLMLADGAFRRVMLVANVRDITFDRRLRAALAAAGAKNADLLFVPDTRGQAETALIAARRLAGLFDAGGEPVVFHNIDTVLEGRDYRTVAAALAEWDGYVDVFPSDSANYSYVAVGDDGAVTEVAEKRVISTHATTGLYGFRSADLYAQAAERTTYAGEFYISDVYRRLLADGARVTVNRDSAGHATTILGTPEEYEAAKRAA